MPEPTTLSKRIKRRVTGRIHQFFAATAPGFEPLCREELSGLSETISRTRIERGGVAFSGRISDAYRANLQLRTANRVLMRIASLKATNFRQLEKRLAEIDWELFLPADCRPEVKVTVHGCRLYHDRAVAERVAKCVAARLSQFQSSTGQDGDLPSAVLNPQHLFVLGTNDRFEVSLDSSGTLLHKRGIKLHVGRAPLRETLAAGVLTLAGFDPEKPLLDPMCGSGTFSMEAGMQALNIAPGWYRDFAFKHWPCFKAAQWAHIRKQAGARIIADAKALIFASDLDREACNQLANQVNGLELGGALRIANRDFFKLRPQQLLASEGITTTGLVVLNPPYGHRIEPVPPYRRSTLFERLAAVLSQQYRGWKLALVAPPRALAAFNPLKLRSRPLHHGGLKLTLLTGRIG